MKNFAVLFQMEMLLRLVIAAICGGVIGYERKNRGKGAGIRTHIIVSIGACLLIIISQYGFIDFFRKFSSFGVDMKFDPSRIGAQIVSGIGFLGAGMIFVHRKTVTGLTTAAGVWATSGIGMAIGCGMYFMGLSATVLVVVIQIILHKNLKFLRTFTEKELSFVIEDEDTIVSEIIGLLENSGILSSSVSFNRMDNNLMQLNINAHIDNNINMIEALKQIHKNTKVKSVNIIE